MVISDSDEEYTDDPDIVDEDIVESDSDFDGISSDLLDDDIEDSGSVDPNDD